MAIYQEKNKKKWTKDGRSWYFRVPYTNLTGERKQHYSRLYLTKKEAQEGERQFLASVKDKTDNTNMRFKNLYSAFYEHQKEIVKETTFQTYLDRVPFLEYLDNIRLVDFNINHYNMWKRQINNKQIATSYKNDILKFLKAILNFGTKWYNFNFTSTYNKMTNFTDPNEIPKEMEFYTYEEFKKFISYEKDLKYICLFETLYYCGLRNGEMRGLTWEDIDFNKKQLRINKQIPTRYTSKNWKFTTPKTKSSNRTLPICNTLLEHLKMLYNEVSQYSNFKSNWFVFGQGNIPIVADNPNDRQKAICKKAGLKKIRIHDFRHSCASLLINNRANVTVVAKFLGHTKVEETLNTYSHMFESALNSVIDVINNIDKIQATHSNEIINTINELRTNGVSIDDILNQLNNLTNHKK